MRNFKFQISNFKISNRIFLFFLVFLLFTVHCSLFTAYADEIRSRAAVVMDAATGRILYAKNPNLRLPPASTTKLMTAIVVMDKADLTDIVTISRNASHISPLKAGFKEGDKVTVETLLYAGLLKSANDAAVALAEAVAGSEGKFVLLMNRKAIALGLGDTKFVNSHGLPGPGQYTTALDLSKIMRYALRYPKLKEIMGTRVAGVSTENGNAIFLKNTNRLLWADEDLVGGKTGFTRKAKHCFVCASERDNDMVIVTLLGSSSRDGLWKEAGTLIGRGFQIMANKEEPVIYFTKADYDALKVKKTSYKKNPKINPESSSGQKSKIETKTKLGKKKNTKIIAKGKSRKGKNYKVAKKSRNGNKG